MTPLCNLDTLPHPQIAEVVFSRNIKSKNSSDDDKENSVLPPSADPETNIYGFGILLLEIISGKLPYSEEQGSLVNWVSLSLDVVGQC